jgi:hypothetical protein
MANARPKKKSRAKTTSRPTFPYSDARIREALARWTSATILGRGGLKPTDRDFKVIVALAHEGANHILARRAGARKPRVPSADVTRRLEATLDAYRSLSPNLQTHPTGEKTIEWLRKAVIERVGLRDDELSEETVRNDINRLRPMFRLVRQGIIPLGKRPAKQKLSAQTHRQMDARRRAHARIGGKQAGKAPPDGIDPDVKIPAAVRAAAARAESHYRTGHKRSPRAQANAKPQGLSLGLSKRTHSKK